MKENEPKRLYGATFHILVLILTLILMIILIVMAPLKEIPFLLILCILLLPVNILLLGLEIYWCYMKSYILNNGEFRMGLLIDRHKIPMSEYSNFTVEFENDDGKTVQAIFSYRTHNYYGGEDYGYLVERGIEYDNEDLIPLFVYKNYAYYSKEKLEEIKRQNIINKKKEERLNGKNRY